MDASEIESGMSAEVWYTGGVQETYPAKFSQVVAVSLSREDDARYDLCGLYLQVLEDLWNEDDGLNGGAEVVSVDLSKAPGGLTAGEKAAVAYVFAQKHGVQGLTMTFDELREEGYLMGEKLEGGSTAYSFTNGLLFTITPEETQDNGASVCFSAGKWALAARRVFFYELRGFPRGERLGIQRRRGNDRLSYSRVFNSNSESTIWSAAQCSGMGRCAWLYQIVFMPAFLPPAMSAVSESPIMTHSSAATSGRKARQASKNAFSGLR